MLGLPDAAVGAIGAGLIAGVVSLLGLIISKELKVSEFRQAWIDALRADTAALLANATAMHAANLAQSSSDPDRWKDLLAVNEASAKVKLRLNPKESESITVLRTLDEHESQFVLGKMADTAKLNELDKKLVAEVQTILKKEWNRVRSGEPIFRVARTLAIIVIVVSFVFIAFPLWRLWKEPPGQWMLESYNAEKGYVFRKDHVKYEARCLGFTPLKDIPSVQSAVEWHIVSVGSVSYHEEECSDVLAYINKPIPLKQGKPFAMEELVFAKAPDGSFKDGVFKFAIAEAK